jgi:hypothetical protein
MLLNAHRGQTERVARERVVALGHELRSRSDSK